ncbi:LCP family protein [Clostridium sp. MB40-C1]|uniref:LCP family protein n=1 Tax=Clostridium sp. MB40-C1 TaxID=3070996 RepID=UPI0027E14779|nr:LCP family protein [Clostridium sp. MB40-C1]WMJ79454.1 LCP family protein [Clostridium sp. MB40-C1]
MRNSRANKNKEKKDEKKKKAVKIILTVFFLILCCFGGLYYYVRHNIKVPDNGVTYENSASEQNPEYEEQEGINNILLIGVDSRDPKEKARSDSMIIMTIDDNNKKLKLTSIMRDSYVPISGHGEQKINAAFAFGGPELLLKTLRDNFKISINKYIIIDFWGFEGLIDAVGGIDVDVKDYEIKELNKFIGESTGGKKSLTITHSGMQHLDGQQALSYARIRKVGNGTFERDQRQRFVISLLAKKLEDINIIQYPKLLNSLLPIVKTNIEPVMLLNYGYTVSKIKPLTIEQLQIPQNELSEGRIYMGSWVQIMDIEQNAKILNDFIFNDKKPDKKEYNISQFKQILKKYLRTEKEIHPHVDQDDPELKKEPESSDHSYPYKKSNKNR